MARLDRLFALHMLLRLLAEVDTANPLCVNNKNKEVRAKWGDFGCGGIAQIKLRLHLEGPSPPTIIPAVSLRGNVSPILYPGGKEIVKRGYLLSTNALEKHTEALG